MSETQELEDRVVDLTADVEQVRGAAEEVYADWVDAQAEMITPFLVNQARETAMTQSKTTEAAASKITALKVAVAELGEESERAFRTEFATYEPPSHSYNARRDLSTRFQKFASSITKRFGELMTATGYDKGHGASAHPGIQWSWGYYRVGQYARVSRFDEPQDALTAYEKAVQAHDHASSGLHAARTELSKANAASIWGD